MQPPVTTFAFHGLRDRVSAVHEQEKQQDRAEFGQIKKSNLLQFNPPLPKNQPKNVLVEPVYEMQK